MTELQRCQEMNNYFDEKIFEPAIKYAKDNNIKEIAQGARYTRMRMNQLDSKKKLQYFWSAIQGTEKSIEFSKLLKSNGVLRFEDILEEVRIKFNDEYFKEV